MAGQDNPRRRVHVRTSVISFPSQVMGGTNPSKLIKRPIRVLDSSLKPDTLGVGIRHPFFLMADEPDLIGNPASYEGKIDLGAIRSHWQRGSPMDILLS